MMNDMVIDELLTLWKTERAPRPDTFTPAEDFEVRLFAAIKAEEWNYILEIGKIRPVAADDQMSADRSICASMAPPAEPISLSRSRHAFIAPGSVMRQVSFSLGRAPMPMPSVCSDFEDGGIPDGGAPVFDTEEYKTVGERPFVAAATNPLSTFGADVDTAMYANLRRMVMDEERLPPPEAVRLEELVNYFHYDYPVPREGEGVMRPHFELGEAPWAPERRLLLVGVQAKEPVRAELPPSHYVFLIDNSGSMYDVFPMVKAAMTALAKQLRPCDRVSMVTYGGCVKVLLEGCAEVEKICRAIAGLEADGCTPGGAGIQTAYKLAEKQFITGGNNRIVLVTDGDFNVGASSEAALVEMVKAKRDTGIYLSIAGCGMGNYKDNKLKMLANQGNGNVFYLDSIREAERVFVHGMTGNMYALARDVKFQIEFNPELVYAYRLLGYELREMTDRNFRDDDKESGTVGLGQQLTALYELIPADADDEVKNKAVPEAPPLKYRSFKTADSDELLTFRIRWREPQGKKAAAENAVAVKPDLPNTANWGWAAAVVEFALALRRSKFAPDANFEHAAEEAQKFLGDDASGERAEFLLLLRRAAKLRRRPDAE